MLPRSLALQFALIALVGTGLLGCFGATIGLDLGRGSRTSRRLARPRVSAIRYDEA